MATIDCEEGTLIYAPRHRNIDKRMLALDGFLMNHIFKVGQEKKSWRKGEWGRQKGRAQEVPTDATMKWFACQMQPECALMN